VLATCGTFDYTFVVPAKSFGGKRQMQGVLREPIQVDQERPLGHAPLIQAANITGRSGSCCVGSQLTATAKQHAMASSFLASTGMAASTEGMLRASTGEALRIEHGRIGSSLRATDAPGMIDRRVRFRRPLRSASSPRHRWGNGRAS
jgi:hypothetical protein